MKKFLILCLFLCIGFAGIGQTLYVGNYTSSNVTISPLNTTASEYTVSFASSSSDAYISSSVLEGGGNYITPTANLVIDGAGKNIEITDNINHSGTSDRTVTIQNANLVHFNGGNFSKSNTGVVTLRIGEDLNTPGSLVQNLEFTTSDALSTGAGIYEIAVSGITDNVGVTFPAISESKYSKVKFNTWTSTNSTKPTFQTYVKNDGDRMICSPTTDGFTTVAATSTINTSSLYRYNASTGAWQTTSLALTSPGIGYFGFVGSGTQTTGVFLASDESTVSITGIPNEDFDYTIDHATNTATGGSGDGWNLIANPFPAPLNWTSVSTLLTNINNAIYIWDPSTLKYNYYVNGVSAPTGTYKGSSISAVVPPMQSFWVQASSSTPSPEIGTIYSFSNTTIKSSPTVYKTMPDNLIIKLGLVSDSTEVDAFWIKNVSGTTLSFEGAEDAWKYKNPHGPSIYTTDSLDEGLAINSIDLSTQNYVPFTVEPKATGNYYLDVEQIISNPTAYQIYLLNLDNNSSHDLSNGPATLSLDSGFVYDDSYALFITSTSTVGFEEYKELYWSAFATTNGIQVEMGYNNVNYELLDVNGKLLGRGQFNQEMTIPTHGNGIRILKVSCADGTAVKKFSILNEE